MKKLLATVCMALILMSGCTSLHLTEPINDGIVDFRDPFSAHLALYEAQIKDSKTVMWTGIGLAGSTFAAATATQSLIGFEQINPQWKWGTLSFSITSIIGLGVAIYGFHKWDKSSKDYIETLRLQTQYYNLVK